MNDTTRRFLNAIVERLPPGEIVELRLFPAIRHGSTESGAAVVALDPSVPTGPGAPDVAGVAPDESTPAVPDELVAVTDEDHFVPPDETNSNGGGGAGGAGGVVDEPLLSAEVTSVALTALATMDTTDPEAGPPDDAPSIPSAAVDGTGSQAPLSPDGTARASLADADADDADDADDSPYRDELAPAADDALPSSAEQTLDEAGIKRYAILSARYRLLLKGPDRGKWDLELKHEADAPLDTVERVARGVARRAGDESDPETFSGEGLRLALEAPAWATP